MLLLWPLLPSIKVAAVPHQHSAESCETSQSVSSRWASLTFVPFPCLCSVCSSLLSPCAPDWRTRSETLYLCGESNHFGADFFWMTVSCRALPSSRPPALTQWILCASAGSVWSHLVCSTVEHGSSAARPVVGGLIWETRNQIDGKRSEPGKQRDAFRN